MWFKNLRIFRLTSAISQTPEEINDVLAAAAFKPCGSLDPIKYGWTPPLGRHGTEYIHVVSGYIMVCAKRQEKIIPSAVINETLEEKILEINSEESRHVSRAERQTLKDEVIFSLMPKALAKSSLDYAYIDTHTNLIIVNVSSAKRAEDLLSALREALGTLKAIPLTPQLMPTQIMTQWVTDSATADKFELGQECELAASKDGRTIRCKNQDLSASEILSHLESGMFVKKLALEWNEAISCVVDDQFAIKRIKYQDAIQEKANDYNAETAAEQFDIDFSIMTLELAAFIKAITEAFGGLENVVTDD
ncbi:MAG: recombination associated protein RdgC [Lentisphaeria bacterium]|jgi:recombination associated protein RdgC